MEEQTNQGVDLGVSSPSIEERMQAFVNNEPTLTPQEQATPPQEAAPQDPPQGQEQSDELTAEDLADEGVQSAQPASEVFDVVFNGQPQKLTRDQLIEYASKGSDYTQKTQEIAETKRQYSERLQALAQIEQVQPILAQEMAQVTALQHQLQSARYSDQEMLRLARDDFVEHAQRSEERRILQAQMQQAAGQYQQKAQAVQQYTSQLQQFQLEQEAARLPEVIQEWRNPETMATEKAGIAKHLQSLGADMNQIGRYLDNALAMKVARDSYILAQLRANKASKSKQLRTVPPVPRPGAPSPSAQAEKETQARQRLSKTHSREDAVGLLLTRMTGG